MAPIIEVKNLSKRYQLGTISRHTLREEIEYRWHKFRHRNPKDCIKTVDLEDKEKISKDKKQNNKFWALKNISFDVEQGEIIGIIGKNGAGKSTLLKILSRITKPTEGTATINGRIVSMLEIGTGFHPELTGRENVYLNGAILGMRKKDMARRMDEIISFSGLERFIETPIKRYSSGMYVRLAFAVAANLDSEIMLVDEVLAVGDAEFQRKSLSKMDELRQQSRTILLVSHNLFSIEQMCSRVLWMESGKIKDEGDVKSMIRQYVGQPDIPYGGISFDSFQGSNGAGLENAYVMSKDRKVSEVLYEEPFEVVIEYFVKYPIENLRTGFRLWNAMNAPILHTSTVYSSSLDQNMCGTSGRHVASVLIPKAWLAPGKYYVELDLWSPAVGHHQHVMNAFTFSIVDDKFDSEGGEALRPILDWHLK